MKIRSLFCFVLITHFTIVANSASITDMGIYNASHKQQTNLAQTSLLQKQTTVLQQHQNLLSLGGLSSWLKGFLPALALPGALKISKSVVNSVSGKDPTGSASSASGKFPEAKKIVEVKNTELQQSTDPEKSGFTNSYETLPAQSRAETEFATHTYALALKKRTEAANQIDEQGAITAQNNQAADLGRVYARTVSTDMDSQKKIQSLIAIEASSLATEALAVSKSTSGTSNMLNNSDMLGGLGSLMKGAI